MSAIIINNVLLTQQWQCVEIAGKWIEYRDQAVPGGVPFRVKIGDSDVRTLYLNIESLKQFQYQETRTVEMDRGHYVEVPVGKEFSVLHRECFDANANGNVVRIKEILKNYGFMVWSVEDKAPIDQKRLVSKDFERAKGKEDKFSFKPTSAEDRRLAKGMGINSERQRRAYLDAARERRRSILK